MLLTWNALQTAVVEQIKAIIVYNDFRMKKCRFKHYFDISLSVYPLGNNMSNVISYRAKVYKLIFVILYSYKLLWLLQL